MIISAMEKMKWTILSQKQTESWSLEEASRSFGTDQAGSEVTFYPPTQQDLGSSTSSDSGSEGKLGKCFSHIFPPLSSPDARTSFNPLSKTLE
jgi:hypothetical protein